MIRNIDINDSNKLNYWINRSINLFSKTSYLDNIQDVYPFIEAPPQRIENDIRRKIIQAHNERNTDKLIELLSLNTKFPYEDPIWYLLKNVKVCLENNPKQVKRIADILYSMTAEETLIRIESPPKLNTQTGPMFSKWIRQNFNFVKIDKFIESKDKVVILDASEEAGKKFVLECLKQKVEKRPDLIAKVKLQYIIGEAKWIGQPGGNQEKQVKEVLTFCKNQRGELRRIGIVDGFPWSIYNSRGSLISVKENVALLQFEWIERV